MSTKTLTREALAEKLDGMEMRNGVSKADSKSAFNNNLVIIHGGSDDLVEFIGAIEDEAGAWNGNVVLINRDGLPTNECDDADCPHFRHSVEEGLKSGEIREIKVFWEGKCKNEPMDKKKYAELGKPTWCYETDMPHATFSMYETEDDERSYYCRGIVIDLDEVFGTEN